MAEYFNTSLATALVWVHPAQGASRVTEEGQALAGRLYYRAGAADLHGFAPYGMQSGASAGAALAWVATDALELHASARYLHQYRGIAMSVPSSGLLPLLHVSTPWQVRQQNDVTQVLLGMIWTSESQHSLLLEAWWDGSAASAGQWRDWSRRNRALLARLPDAVPALQAPLAYNLAWQGGLLSAASNIQRKNLFARWSWQTGAWQPAFDLLWTPEDGGRVATAALSWQGDQLHIDTGVRRYGGPRASVLAQLPELTLAYVAASWAF